MGLAEQIVAVRAGSGDPAAMVGELRRSAVLVPVSGGAFVTGLSGGVRWLLAFTSEASLARFARVREAGAGAVPGREWEFVSVLGARLLDVVIPGWGVPGGVAVDVADEGGAMLFPPVRGIVPDEAAVGTGASA